MNVGAGPFATTPRVAIVADDLTSAMDGAGPFIAHQAARRALVTITDHTAAASPDLVAVDTDSRRRTPKQAAETTARAIAYHRSAPTLIKTIDSTLRGHVRVEVDAAWRASDRRLVIVAPAFPASGRTTCNGTQLVRGVPVSHSEFRHDPRHPSGLGTIANLLAPLATVRADVHRGRPTEGIVIADAQCDADLDHIVGAVQTDDVLWVGSPGLAAALARRHPRETSIDRRPLPSVRRVVVVIGSTHWINAIQLQGLRQHDTADLPVVDDVEDIDQATVAVVAAPRVVHRVSVHSAALVATELAGRARSLIRSGFDALIVTGGETARATIDALEICQIDVLDQPWPGVVVGHVPDHSLTVATKAGGFGDTNTLIDLVQYLLGRGRR